MSKCGGGLASSCVVVRYKLVTIPQNWAGVGLRPIVIWETLLTFKMHSPFFSLELKCWANGWPATLHSPVLFAVRYCHMTELSLMEGEKK